MFRRVTAINNKGEELVLDLYNPELSGLYLTKVNGIGVENVNISTTALGSQDGSVFNNSRVGDRNITLEVVMMDDEAGSVERNRQRLYSYFYPNERLTLKFETDEIDCEISGYVEHAEPDVFSQQESAQISIICPNPCFYANNYTLQTFSGANPLFEFPFSNESLTNKLIQFGELLSDPRAIVDYKGSLKTGMTITIDFMSECDTITLWNVDTDETFIVNMDILLSNLMLQPTRGDKIEINTTIGDKYARLYVAQEDTWYNIMSAIDINSDWLQLTPGKNIFNFQAPNNTDRNLLLTFQWKDAYAAI